MLKFLIKSINGLWLVVVFIGIPAVTHTQFWHLQIGSAPTAEKLMFWGLALGIVMNFFGATIFPLGLKTKETCAKWTLIFGGLLFLEYAFVRGWINFDWLKKSLHWLQNHF